MKGTKVVFLNPPTPERYSGQAATKAAAEAVVTTLSLNVELAAIQQTHFVSRVNAPV